MYCDQKYEKTGDLESTNNSYQSLQFLVFNDTSQFFWIVNVKIPKRLCIMNISENQVQFCDT